ncbi:MAG: amidase [Phycisphaerales bacterium]
MAVVAGATGLTARAASAAPSGDARRQPEPGGGEGSEPRITSASIAAAAAVMGLDLTDAEIEQMLPVVARNPDRFAERRAFSIPNEVGQASVFDPRLAGFAQRPQPAMRWSGRDAGPPPSDDEDLAFAPVWRLSQWLRTRRVRSVDLTRLCLSRLERYGPALECVAALCAERALASAERADEELDAGRVRGPLHGVPYGLKDLFDTARIPTQWGAEPYRGRTPDADADVVVRLDRAGAVPVAKLSLGALAYGDIWYGGTTKNPFNVEMGSSGSSAGSAAATAAGLVPFALGTETLGSIVSPSMRCGTTGLRPTFGRISRAGAMALCWSLDKVGPICRCVEDCGLVFEALHGQEPGDPSSRTAPFGVDLRRSVEGMRVGYAPAWFDGPRVSDVDRAALDAMRGLGVELVEFRLADLPYGAMRTILEVEAASAFEELTLSGRDDMLAWQSPRAWPNTFRCSRMVPAVEYVQAERIRRMACEAMRDAMDGMDAVFGPSFAGNMLLVTNFTGHPCVVLRAGFRDAQTPHGVSLWGHLDDEGTILALAHAMEQRLGVWEVRPTLA